MKIVFFSNFLNHHQLPLCEAFLAKENVEFTFVATEPISEDRLAQGYADMNQQYGFVLRAYESEQTSRAAENLARECDLMIFGAAPRSYLELRMQENKLTFYFSERIFKKGQWRRFIPMTYKKVYKSYIQYKNKPLYVLCASAYTSHDLTICGFNAKKCFKWGYFPVVRKNDCESLFSQKKNNEKVEILYAGRLLFWKRVLDSVKAIHILVKQGVKNFRFTIIGEGEQRVKIEKYIQKNSLQEYIRLLPFMPVDEVRKYMDLSDVYVFSSNHYEGWGAVVNEAMDSACAMVVSHAVGSAPYLIEHEKNGLIYQCGKAKKLAEQLKLLITNKTLRERLAKNAHETITSDWTAEQAADRLLQLYDALLSDAESNVLFCDGVCSVAKPIKNNWIKKEE